MNECAICHVEVEGSADLCAACHDRVAAVIAKDLARQNVKDTIALHENNQGDGFFE